MCYKYKYFHLINGDYLGEIFSSLLPIVPVFITMPEDIVTCGSIPVVLDDFKTGLKSQQFQGLDFLVANHGKAVTDITVSRLQEFIVFVVIPATLEVGSQCPGIGE